MNLGTYLCTDIYILYVCMYVLLSKVPTYSLFRPGNQPRRLLLRYLVHKCGQLLQPNAQHQNHMATMSGMS